MSLTEDKKYRRHCLKHRNIAQLSHLRKLCVCVCVTVQRTCCPFYSLTFLSFLNVTCMKYTGKVVSWQTGLYQLHFKLWTYIFLCGGKYRVSDVYRRQILFSPAAVRVREHVLLKIGYPQLCLTKVPWILPRIEMGTSKETPLILSADYKWKVGDILKSLGFFCFLAFFCLEDFLLKIKSYICNHTFWCFYYWFIFVFKLQI